MEGPADEILRLNRQLILFKTLCLMFTGYTIAVMSFVLAVYVQSETMICNTTELYLRMDDGRVLSIQECMLDVTKKLDIYARPANSGTADAFCQVHFLV